MLVNNAGILRFGEIEKMEVDEFELLFRVNQLGCFLGMKSVARTMRKNGGGSIVNASSIEGLAGMAFCTAYAATKFAIRGMTKSAAMELGPKGIRVNSVHPGMIDTPMTRIHGGDAAMEFGASQGRPQAGRPSCGHRPGVRLPGQRRVQLRHRRRARHRRRRHRHPRLRRLNPRRPVASATSNPADPSHLKAPGSPTRRI